MNIEKIKTFVESNMNRNLKFKINGNRNQIEEFEGIITNAYKAVFLVKATDNTLKSFTYTDILIGILEINV